MLLLEKDTRNIVLTPEFIIKSDLDIQTIKSLSKYAKLQNNCLIITGGYATEAHLGGKITRAHGDIDCILLNLSKVPNEQILFQVGTILIKEKTRWIQNKTQPNRGDWRENRKNTPFNNRRRIELKILDEKQFKNQFVELKLIDSSGEKIKVFVEDIYSILVEKIHKFYLLKDGVDTTKDRESSLSDFVDLARLMKSANVSVITLLKHLHGKNEEYKYVVELLGKIKPKIIEYL
ncbi:MAG: hypothetical protein UR39_C0009G0018 [Candidatus Woesebacteria bacterium GW2011_GWA1_33_30]|uniref:Uncharacterized protein n=1 Tax=Candidatus Woesebacteria bacterium GW2011_GWA2_33_28 TaxID=1618561 RepID=A0A0G0A5V1_9BACT|nr:MAG: hypothetical protein UR38_C0009G0018 [Candidatus Woesebacteria bacterium GW2011_GWA2_33_28]KKP47547.1 MAG: hypothetical protein UR39_C0009G0018 [Candidatus Woesebacteria bacterium GW2011_GWA1_33_30]KKP49159.1 MAG: hypothetical protein UR40_C0010G0018 [Microgenomates group bacterium GW2011_GWC1_33_32]KKP51541.1 MAG: hypothetical protein UR44_C0009G0018 [Candidatus Woesebacteria bacterium GW2011_GWB1_33_38]KKP57725.1 MAG: hypothetical protein UR48_C0011G0013 [Microgenomates group bacteriu